MCVCCGTYFLPAYVPWRTFGRGAGDMPCVARCAPGVACFGVDWRPGRNAHGSRRTRRRVALNNPQTKQSVTIFFQAAWRLPNFLHTTGGRILLTACIILRRDGMACGGGRRRRMGVHIYHLCISFLARGQKALPLLHIYHVFLRVAACSSNKRMCMWRLSGAAYRSWFNSMRLYGC